FLEMLEVFGNMPRHGVIATDHVVVGGGHDEGNGFLHGGISAPRFAMSVSGLCRCNASSRSCFPWAFVSGSLQSPLVPKTKRAAWRFLPYLGQFRGYTATAPLICGCASYPTSSKSSNLKSKMFLTCGFRCISGSGK